MSKVGFLTFPELIEQFFELPEAEAELQRRYAMPAAIMVVDFTSMVKRTNAEGIVYALALARAAESVMRPAIAQRQGEIIKRVADTFFAVFKTPEDALQAALDGLIAMRDFNTTRTGTLGDGQRNDPIWPCVGLGFGQTLVIPGHDLYGHEVNHAFVLGEDVAHANELLCTPPFLQALGTLPPGIGAHRAPASREAELGIPFHVLADYRE